MYSGGQTKSQHRGGTGEEEKGKDNPSYFISVDGHQDLGSLVRLAVQRPIVI